MAKRRKIWVNVAHSFEEAEEFDINYYLNMSRSTRLATMQYLREIYYKFHPFQRTERGKKDGEGRKRLRRVITII